MRQRELFESAQVSITSIPEDEIKLIELLAQLMLSTFSTTTTTNEEEHDEPDQR